MRGAIARVEVVDRRENPDKYENADLDARLEKVESRIRAVSRHVPV